jgi:hypothetical protein
MDIENLSVAKTKKKTIFGRLSSKFINQQRVSKRDQSVQTGLNATRTTTISVKNHSRERMYLSNNNNKTDAQTPIRRHRLSLKTFLTSHSPKLIHRTCRRSTNLKTPKRLSSECLVSIQTENAFCFLILDISLNDIVFIFLLIASCINS